MTYFSRQPERLTTRFDEPPASLFRAALVFAPCRGLAYGGGFLRRAASQSKGFDAESDGEVAGVIGYDRRARGVLGALELATAGALPLATGLASFEGSPLLDLGELFAEVALFAWAKRRSDMVESKLQWPQPPPGEGTRDNGHAVTRHVPSPVTRSFIVWAASRL